MAWIRSSRTALLNEARELLGLVAYEPTPEPTPAADQSPQVLGLVAPQPDPTDTDHDALDPNPIPNNPLATPEPAPPVSALSMMREAVERGRREGWIRRLYVAKDGRIKATKETL